MHDHQLLVSSIHLNTTYFEKHNDLLNFPKGNSYKSTEDVTIKNASQFAYSSQFFLRNTRIVNIFSTILIILFGLIGNAAIIKVFSKTKFRVNSSNIYLLALAVNNNLFLLIHLFEDTLRTYLDVYKDDDNLNKFYQLLVIINVTDKFYAACCIVNYLRYTLRFTASYIILTFTIQRYLSEKSLGAKFDKKESAWKTVSIIGIVSFTINIWVLFFFEINHNNDSVYCDVKRKLKDTYFVLALIYSIIIVIIPILVISVAALNIIIKQNFRKKQYSAKQKVIKFKETSQEIRVPKFKKENNFSIIEPKKKSHTKPCFPLEQLINRISIKSNNTAKITRILITISMSFAALNLPYITTWFMFFYDSAYHKNDQSDNNYLFGVLQIAEIFHSK